MKFYEVEERVQSVLDKEEKEQCYSQTFFRTSTSVFEYKNSEALIELFETIKKDSKLLSFFVRLLEDSIIESIEYPVIDERTEYMGYVNVSTLSFYVLLKLGFAAEALDALQRRIERSSLTYTLIFDILQNGLFSEANLKEILEKLDKEQKPPEPIEKKLRDKLLEQKF
jgi:hypothetical protein